ncbi:beta-galactosidase [Vallitalea okinawensis]|uniref:beta-galactosidase n=1 Tax=Vallitalea okinawensis TaxID=2078660 RepID=UPI000CFC3B48|nr:beta-galactosidase [Vallitalea okinawensis]
MEKSEFIYAAGYYPLMHDEEDWLRDLQLMKASGINLIRTAELFNTWDRIEPRKGDFNFNFLDKFFDLCQEYSIKILLGTGTASPPYWLHELYPDVNILNNHHEQYPNNVSYTWACIDHPGYLQESKRYLTTLVNRYKDHPALYAYQIHNEIGFPFMPLKEGNIDVYCYCNHSIKKFRKWVKDKYQSIQRLNHAYRWGATNTCYTSWDQVTPPRTKPTSWSSVTRWLDWRLYWMENYVDFIGWQHQIIKSLDDDHLTTTNTFFLKSQDPLGVLTGIDQFSMAKAVDIIGYDLYPGSGDKLEKKPEFASMFLDMARSSTAYMDKDYWLLETESGPINGWVLGPSRNVKGFDLMRNIFEAIGHDTKLTLYQGWREWDFQPLHWGAIVDLDGKPTERTEAAARIGSILAENSSFLTKAKSPKAQIAILIAKENAIVLNGMGQEEFLMKALRGAYRIFWEKNYKVDFITPEMLNEGVGSDYKAIYMPFMTCINQQLSEVLSTYVNQGGTLIGTARCGMLGEYGWYNHQIPCHSLQDVFGIDAMEVYANTHPGISYKMKNYRGYWHKEVLKVKNDAVTILAHFHDDGPAVTANDYGRGQAIYFATHPDVAYLEEGDYLLWDVLEEVLGKKEIKPCVEVDYTNRNAKEVDVHYLTYGDEGMLIVTNYVNKQHSGFFINNKKKIRVKINNSQMYKSAVDIETNESIPLLKEKDTIGMELEILKNTVKLIKLL